MVPGIFPITYVSGIVTKFINRTKIINREGFYR